MQKLISFALGRNGNAGYLEFLSSLESLRGEAVWVLGATASELNVNDLLRDGIGDLLEFVLIHDNNDIVKHEAIFQIGE